MEDGLKLWQCLLFNLDVMVVLQRPGHFCHKANTCTPGPEVEKLKEDTGKDGTVIGPVTSSHLQGKPADTQQSVQHGCCFLSSPHLPQESLLWDHSN